jgi:hypothetical protein
VNAERIAKNEALFRSVNERIAESAQRFDADDTQFVCECADATCTDRVPATLDEYESVRSDGATFLVVPGHEDERFESVVREEPRYRIVEKQNTVGRIARGLDPRGQPA